MKRLFPLLLIAVLLLTLCACGGKENTKTEEPKTFRVGFGRVDVTPAGSVSLDGYDPRASEGVLNPVMATCVAITDAENNTILLYTVDMCNTGKRTVSSSGVVPYEVRICKYPRGTAETLAQDLINMLTELQG